MAMVHCDRLMVSSWSSHGHLMVISQPWLYHGQNHFLVTIISCSWSGSCYDHGHAVAISWSPYLRLRSSRSHHHLIVTVMDIS